MTFALPQALGVLGDPVAHSMSPAMHLAALAQLGLPHHYAAYHVPSAELGAALAGARALGFLGLNLTIPHKVAALQHVDHLDPLATRIGAVNTLHFHEGKIHGHNTDAPGFVRAFQELGQSSPSRALVLGSGGAARSVVEGMADAWPQLELDWVTRDPARLRGKTGLPAHLAPRCRVGGYEELGRGELGREASLWVNATSVGLPGGPTDFPVPLPLKQLSREHAVIDIVYTKTPPAWRRAAGERGAKVQDGRVMLLWQGVLALQIWLEQEISRAALDAMRGTLGLSAPR